MDQKLIIKSLKSNPNVLEQYKDSKAKLSSSEVAEKFYNTPGFSIGIFIATKKWFDTMIMPNQKRGLNIQGYMRLIAM